MLQAALSDCLFLDLFPFFENGFVTPEVDIGRCDIVDALVIALLIVVIDAAIAPPPPCRPTLTAARSLTRLHSDARARGQRGTPQPIQRTRPPLVRAPCRRTDTDNPLKGCPVVR